MSKKETVLSLLPALTRRDLQEINLVATHLLTQGSSYLNVELPTIELWRDAINAILGRQKNLNTPTRGFVGKQLRAYAPGAEEFLKSILPKARMIDRAHARALLISLLADDLKRRRVNPTPGILATNLNRLPEVFDDAYPLYRESGLTHLVFGRGK